MTARHRYVQESNIRVLVDLIKTEFGKYLTDEQIQSAITEAVANLTTIEFKKVDALPATGETSYIYLVPNNSSEVNNIYNEYYWNATDSKFELMGTTQMDLSGYVQTSILETTLADYVKNTDLEAISDTEIETIWNSVMTTPAGA